jgi:hypothetical protein
LPVHLKAQVCRELDRLELLLEQIKRALGGEAGSLIGPVQVFRAGVSTLDGPRLR